MFETADAGGESQPRDKMAAHPAKILKTEWRAALIDDHSNGDHLPLRWFHRPPYARQSLSLAHRVLAQNEPVLADGNKAHYEYHRAAAYTHGEFSQQCCNDNHPALSEIATAVRGVEHQKYWYNYHKSQFHAVISQT